ncbi:UDP-N-acetylglucosamine transferase subunit ALG14-like protein [Chlorella sorokiniana]|uniref:UDP-N-acetylglucosamine transferase subunit ALG14 n=1 Tax=Chlorella sorokiniana TaxID=3076 RepID=A0A2P6TCH6_CHLSO|nr:UDP-N-acetylglucosamine transferase subunit ALG14-like protein [Chlorella sorokiniana]|eukprot:PRW20336.1 UDP-N-acetylglucosamine transferase subunit ALG14-like protein [Chlorella sorokiniana]
MDDLAAYATGVLLSLLLIRLLLGIAQWVARRGRHTVRTMIVLGSGGHTAEMMALLQGFDLSVYSPRCYVVAATDGMSGAKAAAFEAAAAPTAIADEEAPGSARKRTPGRGSATPAKQAVQQQAVRRSPRVAAAQRQQQAAAAAAGRRALPGARSPESPAKRRMAAAAAAAAQQQEQYSVVVIPRSREVGQSFLSSVPTTLRALWAAVAVVLEQRPDVVLLNGPGTCIPIAAAAVLLRLLGVCRGRVVYVESIARVYRLSLSGKILYHTRLASQFFVQWEELRERYPRALYAGRLM